MNKDSPQSSVFGMKANHIAGVVEGSLALPGGFLATAEALLGAAAVCFFMAADAFIHWVTMSSGWILFFLVSKPLIDLTWRWEFLNIFHQSVNLQAILGVLVALLNCLGAVFVRRKPRYFRRVVLLLAVATLSVIVTPSSWAVNELVRLFSGVSFFFTAGLVLGEKKNFDRFTIGLLATLCVPLLLSLFQVAGLLPFEYWDDLAAGLTIGRASGTYQHPGEIVFFLIYAVPLALYRWDNSERGKTEHVFLALFFFLAFFGLVFTFHRTGWIVILAELGVWFGSKMQIKKMLFATLVLAVLAVTFSGWISLLYQPVTDIVTGEADLASGNFVRGRGAPWMAFLVSYANGGPVRWIIGKGGSVAEVSLPGIIEFDENEPHDDFIRILHAYGLAGFLLYLSLLAAFVRQSLRLLKYPDAFRLGIGRVLACSVAGILLVSVTLEPMRYPTSIWYLFSIGSAALFLADKEPVRR